MNLDLEQNKTAPQTLEQLQEDHGHQELLLGHCFNLPQHITVTLMT